MSKIFTFSYNDANQIEKKNDTAYQYDADGNLLQDEHFKYTYNEAQRLTGVQTLKGDAVASYTYDENGLRLTKTVGDTTHEYFYNNEVLDMEVLKKNGEITQYRYYEWNGYTPLGMIIKAKNDTGDFETKAYQFITNQRGDVLSIRNQDDQEVGSYSYDAYGNVLSVEGDVAKDNPIRYAGYYYDEETKNYYLQARYYNPENGAFLALDPHPGDDDEPLSQNGYTYGNNNPVIHVDPDGNAPALVMAIGRGLWAVGKWIWKGAKWVWNSTKKLKKKPKNSIVINSNLKKLNDQKQAHILQGKHLWGKVVKNPKDWNDVSKVISTVLKKGRESRYKSVRKKIYKIKKKTVVVTFKRSGEKIYISDAWVRK